MFELMSFAQSRFVRAVVLLVVVASIHSTCRGQSSAELELSTCETVGEIGTNRYYTPVNQVLAPAGIQVELPGMRPQGIALSSDGRLLVTAGKTHDLVVIDPATGKILQHVALPSGTNSDLTPKSVSEEILHPDKEGQLSFTGLVFSPDGSRIYLANVDGNVKVFGVNKDGKVVGLFSIPLPPAKTKDRKADIPAGMAVSRDGKRLYVALNLSNRLAELDAADGHLLRLWEVGVAPFDVVLAGQKVFVSNWGGRPPKGLDVTGPAGLGTRVRVDPVRHIAAAGSVSVIDLAAGHQVVGQASRLPTGRTAEGSSTGETPAAAAGTAAPLAEIATGLHACAMAASPNGRWLVVANAGSDTLSVIDTRSDQVVETLCARQNPADLFGAQPNALAFDKSGGKLFVCNGTQNAVAVFDFKPGHSSLRGLIPVGWFPGGVVFDPARKALCVANIKGIGSTKHLKPGEPAKYNSHLYFGTLSLVPVPDARELSRLTQTALLNLRYGSMQEARLPARPGQPARPVPERAGEPSVFKHVVYIIQENRTYDQVLGDLHQGNGDPSLCVFGENMTPNHHKLAREFVLLDNTYCSGILSADGHQWTDSAMATDYMERAFAGFPRSYPYGMSDGGVDALAYSPTGFIWDNVIAHGKTLRDYGEFAITVTHWRDTSKKRAPGFLDHYQDFISQAGAIQVGCRPAIESLRPYLATNTVGWALQIPDAFRAAQFIRELKQFEQTGEFPNLVIICLPNDHTSGTARDCPTPAAMVADNDRAFGQIVEAISGSRFWKDTCILAIEDDPQAGWDHVSGYRTTCYVASPYTRRAALVSTQYNQTSLLRTMELMLGLPPMNQMDATATPMTACFTNTPDFTAFTALMNNIPLDQMNPAPKKIADPLLRKQAYASARLPLEEADKCPEDTLNRILWHALKGSQTPYPAWAVTEVRDDD
jgi:YVTN family beta-propeller protein